MLYHIDQQYTGTQELVLSSSPSVTGLNYEYNERAGTCINAMSEPAIFGIFNELQSDLLDLLDESSNVAARPCLPEARTYTPAPLGSRPTSHQTLRHHCNAISPLLAQRLFLTSVFGAASVDDLAAWSSPEQLCGCSGVNRCPGPGPHLNARSAVRFAVSPAPGPRPPSQRESGPSGGCRDQ